MIVALNDDETLLNNISKIKNIFIKKYKKLNYISEQLWMINFGALK